MTRRKITRADEATAHAKVAKAIGERPGEVHFSFGTRGRLLTIETPRDCGLSAPEIVALAAAGIHPGLEGWEMDEAPVPVGGVAIGDLFRSKLSGVLRKIVALAPSEASKAEGVDRWKLEAVELCEGKPRVCFETTTDLLDPSQWTRYESTIPRALPAGVAWYQHGIDEHRLEAGRRVLATVRFFEHHAEWAIGERSYEASDGWTIAATLDAAKAAAEAACRERGIFAALPELSATPVGPLDAAGAFGAARTLRRLLSICAREDEHGPIVAPAGETPEDRAAMRGRLVDAFLVEMVAEIGRRVLDQIRDLEEAIAAAREEADTSDANAVELASKLDAAQKRVAEMGGEIDALQTALEASRGARVEADLLHVGAIRRAEKAEGELDAIRAKLAEIIDAAIARKGAAS